MHRRALNLHKAFSIDLDTDKGGGRFNIRLPERTYYLMAEARQVTCITHVLTACRTTAPRSTGLSSCGPES